MGSPAPYYKQKTNVFLNKYFTGTKLDYKQIIAIIIPIFVDQAFIILMSLMNTAMIASSGVAAVSAVSMVDSLNIFLVNVFIAVATGGTVIVAQYKGSGNDKMVSRAAAQAISAVAVISIFFMRDRDCFSHSGAEFAVRPGGSGCIPECPDLPDRKLYFVSVYCCFSGGDGGASRRSGDEGLSGAFPYFELILPAA